MVRPLDIRKSRLLFPPEFLLEFLKNFNAGPKKIPTWKAEKYLRLQVGEEKDLGILQEFRWKKQLAWPIAMLSEWLAETFSSSYEL